MPGGGTAKEYGVAVGYDRGLMLPASRMLLPQGVDGSQIQGFSFAVTAERVSERRRSGGSRRGRARDHAPAVAAALFRCDDGANIDLQVASLTRADGAIAEVFPPHVLLGQNPGLSWKDHVGSADVHDGEAIVFVGASDRYASLVPPNVVSPTFRKTLTTLPMVSRTFPCKDGTVDDESVW